MASFNNVQVMGNLTRDPELKYTESGSAVCDLGMAVNEKYKDKETTTFVDVTVWGTTAENCAKYLQVGSPVFIQGKLKFEQWEKDGQKRNKLSVTGLNVQFLNGNGTGKPAKEDDDIPF